MIRLADIPDLRASAEELMAKSWAQIINALRGLPGGVELLSRHESAARELAIIDKLERDLLANGKVDDEPVNEVKAVKQVNTVKPTMPAMGEVF